MSQTFTPEFPGLFRQRCSRPREDEEDFVYWHRWGMQLRTEIGEDVNKNEQLLLHLFFESFPPHVKREVRKQPTFPETEELLSLLARLKPSIQAQSFAQRSQQPNRFDPSGSREFKPAERPQRNATPSHPQSTARTWNKPNSPTKDFKPNVPLQPNIPFRPKPNGPPRPNAPSRPKGSENVTCFNCGEQLLQGITDQEILTTDPPADSLISRSMTIKGRPIPDHYTHMCDAAFSINRSQWDVLIDCASEANLVPAMLAKEEGFKHFPRHVITKSIARQSFRNYGATFDLQDSLGKWQAFHETAVVTPDVDTIVLGMPWLHKHNPHVDFAKKALQFREEINISSTINVRMVSADELDSKLRNGRS
ncbi:hypothetical protein V8E54_011838 [Elaphomyces granulatus]